MKDGPSILPDKAQAAIEWNWLYAGQTITCDSGHVIATALEDVETGTGAESHWMDKLDWTIDRPSNGTKAVCPTCGCLWFFFHTREAMRWLPDSMPLYWRTAYICIDGEWRKSLTPEARAYLDSMRGFGT